MPFINLNGQLIEVTQEQYDIYTVGQNVNPGTPISPQVKPSEIAAGGNVTITPSATSTILTPNTTNNSPDQILTTSNQSINISTTAPADLTTNSIQDSVSAASINDAPAPAIDTSTIQQLVRDVLAQDGPLPTIDTSTIQQLVNDIIAQTDANTTVSDTANQYYQQLVEAVTDALNTLPAAESPYAPVATVGDTPLVTVDNTTAEPVGTITVESVPAEIDNTTPSPISPENTNYAPVQVTDEPIETNAGQTSLTADELNVIAEAQGVAGEEGNITTDTFDGQLSAAELDAIAAAQGVGGEEGNITADTLARDPGSYSAAELDAIAAAQGLDAGDTATGGITDQQLFDNESATQAANAKERAQQQQTIASQRKQINDSDWRVRLRLAPRSEYLYNAKNPGILQPLKITDGVVFPYTPAINTNYRAQYSQYDLTHSNYRGYFYGSSFVDAINITATFTAQDTQEAEYLLAVITFFKSVTKMFYGQDPQRGSPPPLVYLSGLGEYQFNEHACLVSQFTYNLPADVDYIRARSSNTTGLNFTSVRDRQSTPVPGLAGVSRLANAFLPKGGISSPPNPEPLGRNNPTYVPTKMEIILTLLPVQSRQQVSKQFSLEKFSAGNLIKGGFW